MLSQFHHKHSASGFTLIELMVVVAILALVGIVAVPSYQAQIRKANRAEAKTALMTGSQAMERCYTSYVTYSSANCPSTTMLSAMGNNYFNYTIIATPTTYTITATASAPKGQDSDTDCVIFSINSVGLTTSEDSGGNPSDCW